MEGENSNWSESVEDLVEAGDTDQAIALLESVISELDTRNPPQSDPQLSSALLDLAALYSSKEHSLKADQLQSRALLITQQRYNHAQNDLKIVKDSTCNASSDDASDDGCPEKSSKLVDDDLPSEGCSDDDWEAVADRAPEELLSTKCLEGVSKVSPEDTNALAIKRRGRGTFSYRKAGLYSDQQTDAPVIDTLENGDVCHRSEGDAETRDFKYGTRHVLVLADFPPSLRTVDLEKLLESFKDRGVVIRWVSDTVALAVFRTPSIALEAHNCIQCPFTVRVLDDSDALLNSIRARDLEPPLPRPQTSARTARRLIAQGMGLKLPSPNFGSKELRKQEETRKNRIVSRQNMRDDAWGDDVN